MKNQFVVVGLIFLVFIVLVDSYTYRGIFKLTEGLGKTNSLIIQGVFMLVSLILVAFIIYLMMKNVKLGYEGIMQYTKFLMGYFVLFYVPKLFFVVFLLVRDLFFLGNRIVTSFSSGADSSPSELFISRADFLLQIGIIIAAIPFISIVFGIWKGRYNYKVERINLSFKNLPSAFNGLKIIQISDLHLGSFGKDSSKLKNAIDIINSLEADYVLFTGDIVNNIASEMEVFIPELSRIRAKKEKYSILGNHDYGTYYQWPSEDALKQNMEELYRFHEEAGFHLLRNNSVVLERGEEKIALIGVENWGLPPFPQYGKLKVAMEYVKDVNFKILMSHDPSHWDAVVLPESDIDLTLSGHTHGMQFAIKIPGWRWSPVKFKYPRWAGIYEQDNRYLYVNIGLGYIAFPGRVGTPPEITLFTLNTTH